MLTLLSDVSVKLIPCDAAASLETLARLSVVVAGMVTTLVFDAVVLVIYTVSKMMTLERFLALTLISDVVALGRVESDWV